jgi:hypothetical protein
MLPMSASQPESHVDVAANTLPDWQQDICHRTRDPACATDPDVIETIKRTNRPYFTHAGDVSALQGDQRPCQLFIVIYDPIAPDPEGVINQGQDNLTARLIPVDEGETINERAPEPVQGDARQQPRRRTAA